MMSDRALFDMTVMRHLLEMDWNTLQNDGGTPDIFTGIKNRGIATADFSETDGMEDVLYFILAGDTAIFIDGYKKAIVVSTRGFPNRGVQPPETEVVVQGPKESFNEVLRFNTALIRRRIRDVNLKVKQRRLGARSRTDIALMYLEDIVLPGVLQETERRLEKINVDDIPDAGCVEQLIEENWLSPFPQLQLTERPDKAAAAILEGRIAIVVDCSPSVILVPVTLNAFFQSAEDYYNRWQVMSLTRMLRFAGAFIAVALPGLYIAVALYHPSMIPLPMAEKLAEASRAVIFPAVVEIILLDAAFELLREAGIRLRNASGGTIGIVGGLIIGQSAVEAGLVSPIVVIIVAMTGIATFAIPSVSLVYSLRLIKYFLLILSAVLGFIGLWAGLLVTLIHLAGLRSFGLPYLMPFAAGELEGCDEMKDSIFRFPLRMLKRRRVRS
jgi:spore germination protein